MNNHELDSLESSEALGEDDSAVDFAFDLGTSPHGRDEIQPDIDAYNQINAALKQAKAANMGGRSEEGTSVEL